MGSEHAAPVPGAFTGPAIRILLADDDPASCRFLGDGLRSVATEVVTCSHGVQALELASTTHFDLLLLDCRMPGAGALVIVSALRADPQSASHASIAVATSAEIAPEQRRALLAAGFHDILCKPCTLAQLQQLLVLIPGHRSATCMLDDDTGLRSSGNYTTLRALRHLLGEELVTLDTQLDALSHDRPALGERLHRLRAACGFCGADELRIAAEALQHEVRHAAPSGTALARFRLALQATLHALSD